MSSVSRQGWRIVTAGIRISVVSVYQGLVLIVITDPFPGRGGHRAGGRGKAATKQTPPPPLLLLLLLPPPLHGMCMYVCSGAPLLTLSVCNTNVALTNVPIQSINAG